MKIDNIVDTLTPVGLVSNSIDVGEFSGVSYRHGITKPKTVGSILGANFFGSLGIEFKHACHTIYTFMHW